MEAEKVYFKLKEIIHPIWEHNGQMVAIAKWIESEFTHNDDTRKISEKAAKWDDLQEAIAPFYDEHAPEYEDGQLDQIGEICASKLGYL
jgi:Mg2+/Co2+ transporter CorC